VGIVKLEGRLITLIDPMKVLELSEENLTQPRR
jgi:chemotaxis signal transduction protein